MKSNFILPALIVFSALVSSSQIKSKNTFLFKIKGSVQNYDKTKIYVHHRWDDIDFTDSANVVNNAFKFELNSAEPNMYWFTSTRDFNAQPNLIFFVDDNHVTVKLKGDSLGASLVEAGQTQKDYLAYKALGVDLMSKQQKLQADFTIATQNRDEAAMNAIQQNYQTLNNDYIERLKYFVKTHNKSAVSGYIIYKELCSPNVPIASAEEALLYLNKSLRGSKFMNLASKKINDIKGTQIGSEATDFSQNTPDGKQIKLSDFRGKYVLVDFWASWCRPCRLENPNVVAAYNNFKEKGFTVLSVSLDSNREQWIAAIQTDQLAWDNISDLKGGANAAALLYGIQSIPQNLLIDKTGKIIAKNLRGPALEEKLKEFIK